MPGTITNAAAAGVSPAALMARAGHSDFATTQGYIDLAGETFREEAELLEASAVRAGEHGPQGPPESSPSDYRLSKVIETLGGRPELVNKLFASLTDGGAEERAGRPASSAVDSHSVEDTARPADEEADDSAAVKGPSDDNDMGHRCVVPGCTREGKHKLGVRCRVWHEPSPVPGKSRTSALWSPDSDALLCDEHALGGANITLIYEPNNSGETAIKVIAAPLGADRRTPIKTRRVE